MIHQFLSKVIGRVGILVLAVAGLAACATEVEVPTYADITFSHLDPIQLNVADIEVVRVYQPVSQAPNVETEFPLSPMDVAARWASDRLKPVGDKGMATVRILDASVAERILQKETGVTGLFTTDQSEKYDARYLVEVTAQNPDIQSAATAQAEVSRTQTVPEGLSYNARERIWYELTEKMARDLDQQLSANINSYMTPFLVP